MSSLTPPDAALAARVLQEVGFEERVIGYRLRERMGAVPATLYSFEEVVSLLHDPFPRADWNGLARWVRTVIGDGELAAEMEAVLRVTENEGERLCRVRELMGERLVQCTAEGEKARNS